MAIQAAGIETKTCRGCRKPVEAMIAHEGYPASGRSDTLCQCENPNVR